MTCFNTPGLPLSLTTYTGYGGNGIKLRNVRYAVVTDNFVHANNVHGKNQAEIVLELCDVGAVNAHGLVARNVITGTRPNSTKGIEIRLKGSSSSGSLNFCDNEFHGVPEEYCRDITGNGYSGTVVTRANEAPKIGRWIKGDMVWNSDPKAGRQVGWTCTKTGSPGDWKAVMTQGELLRKNEK